MTAMKQIRISRNLTQKQVAELTGSNKGHYKHVESGRRMPSVDLALAISGALSCSVDDLDLDSMRNSVADRRAKESEYIRKRRSSQPWARAMDVAYCDLPARARKCGVHLMASPEKLIGCDRDRLKAHLESQFRDGMSWSNYGTSWEMDHRFPIRDHDLSTESGQRQAFGFENIQVITVAEHDEKTRREMKEFHKKFPMARFRTR